MQTVMGNALRYNREMSGWRSRLGTDTRGSD